MWNQSGFWWSKRWWGGSGISWTDNHTCTSSLDFLQAGCSSWRPTNITSTSNQRHKQNYLPCKMTQTSRYIRQQEWWFPSGVVKEQMRTSVSLPWLASGRASEWPCKKFSSTQPAELKRCFLVAHQHTIGYHMQCQEWDNNKTRYW